MLRPPPRGDLPDPGIKPKSLMSPAIADGFLTTRDTWEALLEKQGGAKESLGQHQLQF